jgi:hypothetical protein
MLAAVKVTREQFESWRSAKNQALRQFLHDNPGESTLITITAPGFVHASFMDILLLGPDPSRESIANRRTATKSTRAYFNARLHWGEQKNGTRIQAEPAAGIRVERLDKRRWYSVAGVTWGSHETAVSTCAGRQWEPPHQPLLGRTQGP